MADVNWPLVRAPLRQWLLQLRARMRNHWPIAGRPVARAGRRFAKLSRDLPSAAVPCACRTMVNAGQQPVRKMLRVGRGGVPCDGARWRLKTPRLARQRAAMRRTLFRDSGRRRAAAVRRCSDDVVTADFF
ncbi:hypothetical protein F511_45384 [Dorcoceras hygrometricum]|uniref:Uncharacterized protein n=1 Tax=Dorcoceras hygrometricum TaxID=472368 RepID=A0A2Z6ZXA9_9LAMI|nr:hypothetical protein F511_45384 [Dorcoceras hygrometricum]